MSQSTFYTVKFSYSSFDFKEFVFEDPFDDGYVDPKLLLVSGQNGFFTGGTGMWHEYRNTKTFLTKFDITSQVSKVHQIKGGVDFKRYDLSFEEFEIVRKDAFGAFVPQINDVDAFNHNKYEHKPIEFSGYLQDKIELDNMIVNIGVRYDYLDAKGVILNDLSDPNGSFRRGEVTSSSVKSQISPRFGISYPISDRGAVHFSYGFFFQRPNFELLYLNPEFEIDPRVSGRVATIMGNADLKNEKTINYELGLQQQFGEDIGFSLTTYYKDITNLIGTEILAAEEPYARFINLDFGNVVGISTSLSLRRKNLGVFLDYTFQVAEGNASDPEDQFSDAASVPPTESEIQTVPLDWDQTHTVNLSVNFGQPKNWSVGLIGKMGSGLPYTPTSRATRGFRETFENSERKPFQLNFDLQASKFFHIAGLRYTFFAKIFNVLDRRNENQVFLDTGDAERTLDIFSTGEARGLNTLEEFFLRPDFFSEPRRIQMGFKVGF
ncbi:TonB-dependent receptor [candidate division KSB1 bacterium]|nr:TonB-dependent receptor [candidate division KSB1 bacterium]